MTQMQQHYSTLLLHKLFHLPDSAALQSEKTPNSHRFVKNVLVLILKKPHKQCGSCLTCRVKLPSGSDTNTLVCVCEREWSCSHNESAEGPAGPALLQIELP